MQKRNKIISKRLLPGTLIVCLAVPAMFASFGYLAHDEIKNSSAKNNVELIVLSTLMAAACACMLLLPVIEEYKNDYAFASHAAREYLKKEMQEHPELKTFEKVLRNPRAIRSVATMISNSLHKSEQKLVLDAIEEMNMAETHTKEEKIAVIEQAHAKIVKIIQEHASVHPEFADEVLATMAYADTTYVIPTQQHVR